MTVNDRITWSTLDCLRLFILRYLIQLLPCLQLAYFPEACFLEIPDFDTRDFLESFLKLYGVFESENLLAHKNNICEKFR